MYLKINKLDPTHFLSAPELTWKTAFKNTKVKLDLLNDVDVLSMVETDIRGGICHSINQNAKGNNKYKKDYVFHIGI